MMLKISLIIDRYLRTSLVVQWLKICLAMQGNSGSTPGQGTKIPHAMQQLSLHTTTKESVHHNEKSLIDATKSPRAATKTQRSK